MYSTTSSCSLSCAGEVGLFLEGNFSEGFPPDFPSPPPHLSLVPIQLPLRSNFALLSEGKKVLGFSSTPLLIRFLSLHPFSSALAVKALYLASSASVSSGSVPPPNYDPPQNINTNETSVPNAPNTTGPQLDLPNNNQVQNSQTAKYVR